MEAKNTNSFMSTILNVIVHSNRHIHVLNIIFNVITFNNIAKIKYWQDSKKYTDLHALVENNLHNDSFLEKRDELIKKYHPYTDGKSSQRMIKAVRKYISNSGVPRVRKLSFLRRLKIYKIFGF